MEVCEKAMVSKIKSISLCYAFVSCLLYNSLHKGVTFPRFYCAVQADIMLNRKRNVGPLGENVWNPNKQTSCVDYSTKQLSWLLFE